MGVRENTKTRRPTSLTPEGLLEYRVTSLCQVDEHELVAADTAGYIYSLDIRKMGRNPKGPANRDMARYAGPVGSVRQLKKHPTLPRLTAVGLDRMLRVYDTENRKQLDCIYLKQRLNCVLFHKNHIWDSTGDTGVISDDDDDEDMNDDDNDIDQDDVLQDYVDTDESENEDELNSESEIHDSSESGVEENEDKSEDDSISDESGEEENNDESDADSISDENSVKESREPKRRRRR